MTPRGKPCIATAIAKNLSRVSWDAMGKAG